MTPIFDLNQSVIISNFFYVLYADTETVLKDVEFHT